MSTIQPLSPPVAPSAKDLQLTKVAQQFEAIFVRQMLTEARKSHLAADDDTLGGQGMDTFRQMQDDRFADIAAERGSFGLAKMIEAQIGAKLGGGPSTGSGRAGLGSNTYPAQAELVEARATAPTASKEP
jgi:flagellar protein FlgJ